MIFKRLYLFLYTATHFLHVYVQLLYGAWKISKLPKPIVTIFGSARLEQTTPYAKSANQLAAIFTEAKISVLTGGGPGIMEAANCGVRSKGEKIRSIGIGVKKLKEKQNPCVNEYFELDYFFARKWLLTRFSSAFIVFPGGFGTLDELSEMLTLIQTKQRPAAPIILVGAEYWRPFLTWIENETLQHGLISPEDIALFTLTDNLDTVLCIVKEKCNMPPVEKA